jgi:hypothetical protein
MKPLIRGLIVGVIQTALVLGIGGKLLADRVSLPRGWAHVVPADSGSRFEGRYLQLRVALEGLPTDSAALRRAGGRAYLEIRDGRLAGHLAPFGEGLRLGRQVVNGSPVATLAEPLPWFVPVGAADPFARPPGEELYVEVSVPPKGSPRPIQLGIRKDNKITPLGRP